MCHKQKLPAATFVLALIVCAACGTAPRDPEYTLARVQNHHVVRVGLVESPPWVIRSSGEPRGVEPELIRRFAQSLGATPQWFWGANDPHMQALERFELDLVAAGLDATTPWTKRVGLTRRPYFKEQIAVGVPPSSESPPTLDGMNIAVKAGDATAEYIARKHAIPLPQREISDVHAPAAAPAWRLKQLGFTVTKFQLFEVEHVMAVPPGENAWLKKLTEFLIAEKQSVLPLLDSSEAKQ